jgi:hypothetical protein
MFAILHELIDALARVGGLTDTRVTELHQAVAEADPEAKAAAERAKVELSDAEREELARLQAKVAAASGDLAPTTMGTYGG